MAMDSLTLKNLRVSCIIGDLPEEREREQLLAICITLFLPLGKAGASDALEDTVDYAAVARRVAGALKAAQCRMIERAAEIVASLCLEYPQVKGVEVEVEKDGAVENLEGAIVKIARGEIFS